MNFVFLTCDKLTNSCSFPIFNGKFLKFLTMNFKNYLWFANGKYCNIFLQQIKEFHDFYFMKVGNEFHCFVILFLHLTDDFLDIFHGTEEQFFQYFSLTYWQILSFFFPIDSWISFFFHATELRNFFSQPIVELHDFFFHEIKERILQVFIVTG